MLFALARDVDGVIGETLVTVASAALVVASIMWVVLSRMILRNLRKAAGLPTASTKAPSSDIWRDPPPPPAR